LAKKLRVHRGIACDRLNRNLVNNRYDEQHRDQYNSNKRQQKLRAQLEIVKSGNPSYQRDHLSIQYVFFPEHNTILPGIRQMYAFYSESSWAAAYELTPKNRPLLTFGRFFYVRSPLFYEVKRTRIIVTFYPLEAVKYF
jgi:hypothetical protein